MGPFRFKYFLTITTLAILAILISFASIVLVFKLTKPKPVKIRSDSLESSLPKEDLGALAARTGLNVLGSINKVEIVKEFPARKTAFGYNALVVNWRESLEEDSEVAIEISTSEDGKTWSGWKNAQEDQDSDGKEPPAESENFSSLIVAKGNYIKYRLRVITDPQNQGAIEKIKIVYIDSEESFAEKIWHNLYKKIASTRALVKQAFAATTSKKPTDPPTVISRRAWGADPKLMKWGPEYVKANKVIVHHTVMTSKDPNPAATVRAIYYYHSVIRGWGDIGYNFLVDSKGNIYEGRYGGPNVVGGHVYHYNYSSVGVAVMGDFRYQKPNNPIKNALAQIAVWKSATNGFSPLDNNVSGSPGYRKAFPNITYHGSLGNTQCAGTYLNAFIPELRKMAQQMPLELLVRYGDGTIKRVSFSKRYSLAGALALFKTYPGVVLVEPNYIRMVADFPDDTDPNDSYYTRQWNLKKIKQNLAWKLVMGNSDVKIAVLDTGVAYENFADASGTYAKLPDFANVSFDNANAHDFVNGDSHANDDNGHGTAITDIIAASTNNFLGNSSIAPNVTILPIKIANKAGVATDSDLTKAITWAVNQGADVINISLTGPYFSYNIQREIHKAYKQGVVVVAAAGNKSSYRAYSPAGMKYVLGVGATRYDNKKARYSNYGNWLDLFAPGGDLSQDQNLDGQKDGLFIPTITGAGSNYTAFKYHYLQGTSYAGAHVSAVAALLKSKGITNYSALLSTLLSNTKDLGVSGVDSVYRYGLLQSANSLE